MVPDGVTKLGALLPGPVSSPMIPGTAVAGLRGEEAVHAGGPPGRPMRSRARPAAPCWTRTSPAQPASSVAARRSPADLTSRPGPPAARQLGAAWSCGTRRSGLSSDDACRACGRACSRARDWPRPGRDPSPTQQGSQPGTQEPGPASPWAVTGPRSRAAAATRPAPRPALLPCWPARCVPHRAPCRARRLRGGRTSAAQTRRPPR